MNQQAPLREYRRGPHVISRDFAGPGDIELARFPIGPVPRGWTQVGILGDRLICSKVLTKALRKPKK